MTMYVRGISHMLNRWPVNLDGPGCLCLTESILGNFVESSCRPGRQLFTSV